MEKQQPQRPARSATTLLHTQANAISLDNISAADFNQIKVELQVLRIDFERIYNGYTRLDTIPAELLLYQYPTWREYLLENVYVETLHHDHGLYIVAFLEAVERQSRLRGTIS